MPGLTSLPTTGDDSLGPNKSDRVPTPDRVHYSSASEWNVMRDVVIAIAGRLGLNDGSVSGSLEAIAPNPAGRARIFEDFMLSAVPSGWAQTGAGAAVLHMTPTDLSAGTAGVVRILSSAGSQSMAVHTLKECLCVAPVGIRAAFRARASSAAGQFGLVVVAGVAAAVGTTANITILRSGATWRVRTTSIVGGASQTINFGTWDSLWHLWEIRATPTSFQLRQDGALVASHADAAAIPTIDESLAPFTRLYLTVATLESVDLDYVDGTMVRSA